MYLTVVPAPASGLVCSFKSRFEGRIASLTIIWSLSAMGLLILGGV